jgi:hypothetical protein
MILRVRELLEGALGAAGLQTTTDVWQIAEAWSLALGRRIADRATPLRLVRGELVVGVADAVWRQELALLAPQLVARLNEALGREAVQKIRLVGSDASGVAERPPDPRRRLEGTSTAAAAGDPAAGPRGSGSAARDDVAAALRSLAVKRSERLLADAAGGRSRPRSGT